LGDGSESAAITSPSSRKKVLHEPAHSHASRTLLAAALVLIGWLLVVSSADARPAMREATATWYGPGFYGNTTACGQRYTMRLRGVAVPAGGRSRCGQRLTICRRGVCVRVRVIDTGAFAHTFDLSARTAMDLCGCWQPYTMQVRWHRGWRA
jgi:hypothetical protein